MPDHAVTRAKDPVVKVRFLSHGTLESRDLDRSARFYAEFLGLEVVKTSPRSLMVRLGGDNTIAVVASERKAPMSLLNHNGLDVATREEVDRCYEAVIAAKDEWGVTKISRPADQHGTYAFYFRDPDENWWEILTNPVGGYSWLFGRGDAGNWGAASGFNPNEFTEKKRPKRVRG